MQIIIISSLASLATIILAYFNQKKRKANINELLKTQTFTCFKQGKKMFISLAALLLFAFMISYYAFLDSRDTGIALLILLSSIIISEPLFNADLNYFYYNDQACILTDKIVPYKSIKEVRLTQPLPFLKAEVITYNNDRYKLDRTAAALLKEKVEQRTKNKKG